MHNVQQVAEGGLRERKKRETHRALSTAARELVSDRGLEDVTIEEIAAAADVSPRTFFNHFSCKEEAVVGIDPQAVADLAEELRARPIGEGPTQSLRAVLLPDTAADADEVVRRWQLRNELVRTYPALLPRHLAAMVEVEEALSSVLAERLDVDPRTDPTPRVMVAAVLAATRSALSWWWDVSDRETELATVVDRVLDHILPKQPGRP